MEKYGTRIIDKTVPTANVPSGISVGQSVSVTLLAANPNRKYMYFAVPESDNGKQVWIRLYPSSDDNLKRGIILYETDKGPTTHAISGELIYTGEVSAISEDDTNDVFVTEF